MMIEGAKQQENLPNQLQKARNAGDGKLSQAKSVSHRSSTFMYIRVARWGMLILRAWRCDR